MQSGIDGSQTAPSTGGNDHLTHLATYMQSTMLFGGILLSVLLEGPMFVRKF